MPVTPTDLDDIQGIITTGYKHLPRAAYLFISIAGPEGGRSWLARIADSVTSSRRWTRDARSTKAKPSVAVNIALTAAGLRAIGLPSQALCTFPREFQEGIASEQRSRILGDTGPSAPDTWEIGGPRTSPVHAMLLLFASDDAVLDDLCHKHRDILASCGIAELPDSMQRGCRPETGSEPFGFHDGIAQPSIAGIDGDGVPTGEFILGYENRYGLIPPTPVVPGDLDPARTLPRLASPYHDEQACDLGRNGSYLVYRKLEQEVAAFWQFMAREAARERSSDPSRIVWFASKCIGRWPSGAPLVSAPDGDDPRLADEDGFYYADDAAGLRCPVGAHVRRTNPRDGLKPYPRPQSLNMTEAHRLIRRGRAYGPPLFDARLLHTAPNAEVYRMLAGIQDDGKKRGVHFFCVNASVKSQFEFVQQAWCNNPRFGGLDDNMDPLTSSAGDAGTPSRMTIPGRRGDWRTHPLPRFVTVRAGAYLFLPSITGLRYLASIRPVTSSSRS